MNGWICAECGHEFPEHNAEKIPDKNGSMVSMSVGGVVLLLGMFCFIAFLTGMLQRVLPSPDVLKFAILGTFTGTMGLYYGWRQRQKFLTVCPACGKAHSHPVDSQVGTRIRRRFPPK